MNVHEPSDDDDAHATMTTYRREDGSPCGEAVKWSTSGEHLHHEVDGEPVEFVAETWVRVAVCWFVLDPAGRVHNPVVCRHPVGGCVPCMVAYRLVAGNVTV